MTNIYLEKVAQLGLMEKVAGNAYKSHLEAKGLNTSGMSNASILAGLGQSNRTFSVPAGDKAPIFKRGLGGIGPKKQTGMAPSGAVRQTGDVLAKGDLASRLSAYKARPRPAAPAPAGARALVGKALGLVRRHPIAAAGGALAAGVAAGRLTKRTEPATQAYGPY